MAILIPYFGSSWVWVLGSKFVVKFRILTPLKRRKFVTRNLVLAEKSYHKLFKTSNIGFIVELNLL